MSNLDRGSKLVCQTDEKDDDLKCPFCEVYFEKWGFLKQHLVRHVSEARAGKDFIPVLCSRASTPCLPAPNKNEGLATATFANDINCSSFNQLSDSGQGLLPNDEACVVSGETHEKSNEHPFLYARNVIKTDGHFISKRTCSEKKNNTIEVRLGNGSNIVDVSMLNQIGIDSAIIDPLIGSSTINPKTHLGFVMDSSSGVYDGHTSGQTIACNTMKPSHRPYIHTFITNANIADSSPSVITSITLSPAARTSTGTLQSTARSSSSILTSNIRIISDSVSNKNILPNSSLSQLPITRAVPSLFSPVGVTSLAPCDEPLEDQTNEESIDDPGFPLQNPSTNLSPRCGSKKLLQCVVRPYTNLSEMDQSQSSFLVPTHSSQDQLGSSVSQTPVLQATKSLSAYEVAPHTATQSQCTGTVLAAINVDHALTLGSSNGSEPSISTELPSNSTAAKGLLLGAAAVGSVYTTADEDGGATFDVIENDKKTNRKSQHCRTCRKFFPSRESMQQHQTEANHEGRPFKCSECARHFLSSHNLSTHRRHRHPSTAAVPSSSHHCGECGKSFSSKANLALHAKLHSGERPFLCTVCGARFSRKCTLVSHLAYHSGDRRFTCDRCGARFYTSHSLARHAKLHSGERSFVCEVCGSSYVASSDLKRHQLSHGSVKPFACTTCTKTFARKHDLKVHERYHSGEFSHECPHCCKRFVEQSNYRRHLRQHTGEKPYRCPTCPLHFSQLHHLKKHQLSCSGPAAEDVSAATTVPLTAGPRITRVGHLQKMNGS